MLYVWYLKNRTDLNIIHEENDIIEMQEELVRVKAQLKRGKHTCYYEDGTPKNLRDPLSLITGLLQDSYQQIIGLL